MKCIDKYLKGFLCVVIAASLLAGCTTSSKSLSTYESTTEKRTAYRADGFAKSLCVEKENILPNGLQVEPALHAAALFRVSDAKVLYANNIHKKLYPASTTKLLTALVALQYGNLSDVVTISKNATLFPIGSSLAEVKEGDQLTLEELLYGLLLPSGNDAAYAIAEHISGNVDEFASLMNSVARNIGATHTHFTNPHGLHDDNHYTTAYDLYLIFNECRKYDLFTQIVSQKKHDATIKSKDGSERTVTWESTNWYLTGETDSPKSATIIGGKTGNTNAAKRCLVTELEDKQNQKYIAIVMGAETKPILYENMTKIIDFSIQNNESLKQ